MTPILLRIASAAFLALTSLIVILFRVSPLTSPGIAVPFFFLTLFLSVACIGTLVFYAIWHFAAPEGMDDGKRLSVALREGIFLSLATALVFLFLILAILSWWTAVLIYLVFCFIELALHA